MSQQHSVSKVSGQEEERKCCLYEGFIDLSVRQTDSTLGPGN